MIGVVFSLVVSGAVMLSGLVVMASVITGSRSEADVKEWEERGRFYRDIRERPSDQMVAARIHASSPGQDLLAVPPSWRHSGPTVTYNRPEIGS